MTSMAPQPPPDDDLRSDPDVPEGVRYDPDLAVHEPMQVPERPPDPSRRRTALLLFPFGLLALSLGVYVLFGLIAEEGKTAADYLDDIRLHPGSGWQAALELSRLVSHEDAALRDPRFVAELLSLFEGSAGPDPRLRRYLALTLGRLRDPRSVDALVGALDDPDLMTRLYALEALGAIGDPLAISPLLSRLSDADPDVRKVTAHALGSLGGARSIGPLRGALNDPVVDVAWNAALSLARLGDPGGAPLLARMLDRSYLDGVTRPDESNERRRMSEVQKEQAMINALSGLALLGDRDHLERVGALSEFDPSLRVRQAALAALGSIREPAP
jgi:hypothetical protein